MNETQVFPEVDRESYNDEVDALFVKTQMTQEEEEAYDMYIPLSVQMENSKWNVLVPSSTTISYNNTTTDSNEPVQIPQSRERRDLLRNRSCSQDYENGSICKSDF